MVDSDSIERVLTRKWYFLFETSISAHGYGIHVLSLARNVPYYFVCVLQSSTEEQFILSCSFAVKEQSSMQLRQCFDSFCFFFVSLGRLSVTCT